MCNCDNSSNDLPIPDHEKDPAPPLSSTGEEPQKEPPIAQDVHALAILLRKRSTYTESSLHGPEIDPAALNLAINNRIANLHHTPLRAMIDDRLGGRLEDLLLAMQAARDMLSREQLRGVERTVTALEGGLAGFRIREVHGEEAFEEWMAGGVRPERGV